MLQKKTCSFNKKKRYKARWPKKKDTKPSGLKCVSTLYKHGFECVELTFLQIMEQTDACTSKIVVRCANPHNFVKKCGILRHPCVPHVVEIDANQINVTLPVSSQGVSEMIQGNSCDNDLAKLMLFQLSSALQHIHSRKIILQHIQPDGIYFNGSTFVFANISQASFVGTGDVKYNLSREIHPFLAPESLDYKMFSTKSDVFCLGLVSACIAGSIKNYNSLSRKELMDQAFSAVHTMNHVVFCLSDNQHSRPTAQELSQHFASDEFQLPGLEHDPYLATIESVIVCGADYNDLNAYYHRVFEFIPCFLIEFTSQMTQLHGQFRNKIAPRVESFLEFCVSVKTNQPQYNLFLFVEKNDVEHLENFFIFCFGVSYENAKVLFQDCVQLGLLNIDEFFIEKIVTSGTYCTEIKIDVLKLCLQFCAKSGTVKLVSSFLEEVDNMQIEMGKTQNAQKKISTELDDLKQLHVAEKNAQAELLREIDSLRNALAEEKKRKTTESDALRRENDDLKTKMARLFDAFKQVEFNT